MHRFTSLYLDKITEGRYLQFYSKEGIAEFFNRNEPSANSLVQFVQICMEGMKELILASHIYISKSFGHSHVLNPHKDI